MRAHSLVIIVVLRSFSRVVHGWLKRQLYSVAVAVIWELGSCCSHCVSPLFLFRLNITTWLCYLLHTFAPFSFSLTSYVNDVFV